MYFQIALTSKEPIVSMFLNKTGREPFCSQFQATQFTQFFCKQSSHHFVEFITMFEHNIKNAKEEKSKNYYFVSDRMGDANNIAQKAHKFQEENNYFFVSDIFQQLDAFHFAKYFQLN